MYRSSTCRVSIAMHLHANSRYKRVKSSVWKQEKRDRNLDTNSYRHRTHIDIRTDGNEPKS